MRHSWLVALALAACGASTDSAVSQLVAAKDQWQETCPTKSYTYIASRKSAWGSAWGQATKVKVRVQDSKVVEIFDDQNRALEAPSGMFTIPEMFNLRLESLKPETKGMLVTEIAYSDQYGYPTLFRLEDKKVTDARSEVVIHEVQGCGVQQGVPADGSRPAGEPRR